MGRLLGFVLVIAVLAGAAFWFKGVLDEPAADPAPDPERYGIVHAAAAGASDPAELRARFVCSDPDAFVAAASPGGPVLELRGKADYVPPVRSPRAVALWRGHAFGDFVLEAELMQTGREYGHRDLCLFFGFEDPESYRYVHLASKADAHAHNVFVVDGDPRRAIATHATGGVDWGDGVWHRVRVERRMHDGRVRVFFDDFDEPVLEATDPDPTVGLVGFGSFDDVGKLRGLEVRATGYEVVADPEFVSAAAERTEPRGK